MKPIPPTKKTLALRTDYSDNAAWAALCDAIQNPEEEISSYVDFVSDPEYTGLEADELPSIISEDSNATFAFMLDHTTMSNAEHPILVVDLAEEPGRSFRVILAEMGSVENNLTVANMGFEEFVEAADSDGIFRGFRD
jgi:hypothetical protein